MNAPVNVADLVVGRVPLGLEPVVPGAEPELAVLLDRARPVLDQAPVHAALLALLREHDRRPVEAEPVLAKQACLARAPEAEPAADPLDAAVEHLAAVA